MPITEFDAIFAEMLFLPSFQLPANPASLIQLLSTMFSTILSPQDHQPLLKLGVSLLKSLPQQKLSLTRRSPLTRSVNHQATGRPHFIWFQSRMVTGAPAVTIVLSMQELNQTITWCHMFRLALLVVISSPRLTSPGRTIKSPLFLRMSRKQQSSHHLASEFKRMLYGLRNAADCPAIRG